MDKLVEPLDFADVASVENQQTSPLLSRDLGLIKHVMVELVVQAGTASLSVDALFALKGGDVVLLQQQVNEPMTLCLDGKPVARGRLVAVDDHFGIQISDIL